MLEYVILGGRHQQQDRRGIERPLLDAILKHGVKLVAEEYPFNAISLLNSVLNEKHIPYLQIDMFPSEQREYGIDEEMNQKPIGPSPRLPNADDVRENFWLTKIEASIERGRVLVICGCHHVDFLVRKITERGDKVIERIDF